MQVHITRGNAARSHPLILTLIAARQRRHTLTRNIMFPSLFLPLAVGLSLSAVQAASECNATCRTQIGIAFETAQHADPTYAFYEPPSNFSSDLAPGTLLRVDDLTAVDMLNWTVPSSLTMSRIIYTTSNINGTMLPTSAYVLWPYTAVPAGEGYPLVAWAHGTSGANKPCAPSNYRNLQYHFQVPYALDLQGMAVVAPDYAGLGINTLPSGEVFRHQYLAAPSHVNDLANAVLAARIAYPALLPSEGAFVAMGHSQGGRTAWGYAERHASKPVAGYKGTVAFAPPTKVIGQLEVASASPSAVFSNGSLITGPNLVDAITAVFPAYNYSGMSAVAYDRWFNVFEPAQGCLPTDDLTFADLPYDTLTKPGWTQDPIVQEWSNLTDVGNKEFAGPMLVLIGQVDGAVDTALTKKVVEETCASGYGEIEFWEYSGVSHFAAIQASQGKWMAWVKERLGQSSKRGNWRRGNSSRCSLGVVEGFMTERTSALGTAPNFFLGWENPQTSLWEYTL